MAVEILSGKADISTMAVKFAPKVTKMYNAANCEKLGVTIPEGYVPIG
jgi:putative ABC transport system substrate-binding protein